MKILLLCETYPSPENLYAMSYVHSRAIEYMRAGHMVSVLSFSAGRDYVFEGIQVLTRKSAATRYDFDVVMAHAPNVRNHLKFLAKFKPLPMVLFIHGHEVLRVNHYYPRPFGFDRGASEAVGRMARAIYDPLKLSLLRQFCKRQIAIARPLGFIFVSDWMRREAIACNPWMRSIEGWCSTTIPNAANTAFLNACYNPDPELMADFVCIRPFDNPKYAVDTVVRWAKEIPNKLFHVYGNGRYFDHHPPPPNLRVIKKFVTQRDIPALLNRYRACVMPTRLDSQGVMMCEMASFGIPLFTSDIDVTRQMLSGFSNVRFVAHGVSATALLEEMPQPLRCDEQVRHRFDARVLAARELDFVEELISVARSRK